MKIFHCIKTNLLVRDVSMKTKVGVFNTVHKPVLTYGSTGKIIHFEMRELNTRLILDYFEGRQVSYGEITKTLNKKMPVKNISKQETCVKIYRR